VELALEAHRAAAAVRVEAAGDAVGLHGPGVAVIAQARRALLIGGGAQRQRDAVDRDLGAGGDEVDGGVARRGDHHMWLARVEGTPAPVLICMDVP
jgi:hypothetical protein